MFVHKTIPCLIAAISLSTHLWAAPTEVTTELALHLKFDSDTQDSSGNNLRAETTGNPTFVEGLAGSHALWCAGDGGRVAVELSGALNFGDGTDFSVALWVKTGG